MLVIKIGGSVVLRGKLESVIKALAGLKKEFVFVHGGGRVTEQIAEKMGVKPKFAISDQGISFRRFTREDLDISLMVAGSLNAQILALFAKYGRPAIGLCGAAGSLIVARRKKPRVKTDEGKAVVLHDNFSGRIETVKTGLIRRILGMGLVPVISFIVIGEECELLTVDADRLAARVAIDLEADKLVSITNLAGYFYDDRLVKNVSRNNLNTCIELAKGGMVSKLASIREALAGGVPEALITDEVSKIETNEGTFFS